MLSKNIFIVTRLDQSLLFIMAQLFSVNTCPCCHFPYSLVFFGFYFCTDRYMSDLIVQYKLMRSLILKRAVLHIFRRLKLSNLPLNFLSACFRVAVNTMSTLVHSCKFHNRYSLILVFALKKRLASLEKVGYSGSL